MKRFIPVFAFIALGFTSSITAQDAGSEGAELNELLRLLEEQTSVATQTRLNADFVPGMFSIMTGEDMHRRGFRTLWEALASVPGVVTVMNETGMRSITVRGVGEVFEPSKVKLLLNGHAINASASATTGTIYDTSVEQIDRVEFIRGPGSATHGEFSFAGVLNIITRTSGELYSAGIETSDGYSFSAFRSFSHAGIEGSINLAASETNGEDVDSGPDRTPIGVTGYSPGDINNKRDFFSAIVDLNFDDLRALIQLQQGNRGDYFGTNNLLPPDERQTVISDTVISLALSQSFDLDNDTDGEWSIAWVQNETDKNELFLGVAPVFGGLPSEDDIVADSDLVESRLEAKISLERSLERHTLFFEASLMDTQVDESEQFINLDPNTNLPSPTMNEFPGPVDEDADRQSYSLVVQDEFTIDDRLTLTSGLRYDDYQDIDSEISPRIALVWRKTDEQIFKVQYAHAFRPPSLIEEGGAISDSIDPESNDTLEIGYIYHSNALVMRNTVYFSKLDDLIVFQDSGPVGYLNTGSRDLYGYELDIERQIGNDWDIHASLSLQDYRDDSLPGAAPWIVKLGAEYALLPSTWVNLEVNSIGSRERGDDDTRSDFEQTSQVDLTLRTQNIFDVSGLDLRWGIRNLLDETLKHPSAVDTYADDYPYSDGAAIWAQLLYRP